MIRLNNIFFIMGIIFFLFLISTIPIFDGVVAQTKSGFIIENEASLDGDLASSPSQFAGEKPKVHVSVEGTPNDDKIRGGEGEDKLSGSKGDDLLKGNLGDDTIEGNNGDDMLVGEDGDDELDGGKGDDELDGGEGDDELKGGKGADNFLCDKDDKVVDFNSNEGDKKEGDCKAVDKALSPPVNNVKKSSPSFNYENIDDDEEQDTIKKSSPSFNYENIDDDEEQDTDEDLDEDLDEDNADDNDDEGSSDGRIF